MLFNRRAKTPAERADAALAVIRAANEEYEASGNGLDAPKYQEATQELSRLGPEVVPMLIAALQALRPDLDTPEGKVDNGIANDIAEALGAIGDPRAVGPLMEAGKQFITNGPRALSMFPAGVDALLGGLDDPDEHVRSMCIDGLAYGPNPPNILPDVVKRMLSDESGWVRQSAAQVVCGRQIRDQELAQMLAHLMREDPEEKVRHMAENAVYVARGA